MPQIGDNDVLEQIYMAKLRCILAQWGVEIKYSIDRAAIDVGVHLWVDSGDMKQVTGSRIWFQVKGFHTATITVVDFEEAEFIITPPLEMEHVRYWYSAPEPVYLVLYIESVDKFLAVDTRDLVDRNGGIVEVAKARQKTVTFKVYKTETIEYSLVRMPPHRSIRIDGPSWRGRPLGHGIDPLRSILSPMQPELFMDVVSGLLAAHDFRVTELEGSIRDALSADEVTILHGQLYLTYEWVLPMMTEFGYDEGSGFRIEGAPFHAQGEILIVIDPVGNVTPESLEVNIASVAKAAGCDRVFVMSNGRFTPAQFGGWFAGLKSEEISCIPQDIGSLTFNVLTTTNVFLDCHDRLVFSDINYLSR